MFDILLNILVGAAVGYTAYKIVESLWPRFVSLWEGLVEATWSIFGYIVDATKDFLASVSKFLQDNWDDIKSFIRQSLGYLNECVVFLFEQNGEAYLGFANPSNQESVIGSIGIAPQNAQLPTQQVIAAQLTL